MSLYLWIKLVHILSATVLFGTGAGTAFFMLTAYLSQILGNGGSVEVAGPFSDSIFPETRLAYL